MHEVVDMPLAVALTLNFGSLGVSRTWHDATLPFLRTACK
jgi:hypothetical protein